ncbi:subclass IId bacteriocin thuricin17 [Marinitoga sp. 1155]|nr:hypothetical protein X274_07965 [Marinitoga sp. 1155]
MPTPEMVTSDITCWRCLACAFCGLSFTVISALSGLSTAS